MVVEFRQCNHSGFAFSRVMSLGDDARFTLGENSLKGSSLWHYDRFPPFLPL